MREKRLIVGLGNPGKQYDKTRHNFGFEVVGAVAQRKGFSWRKAAHLKGMIAQGQSGEHLLFLLMPETYMNSSGQAVRLCVDYYEIPSEALMVVADDIAFPFGTCRMRSQGSAGGHNGLESVENHLGTRYYARLRMGIGNREEGTLTDHVLGKFAAAEVEQLPEIINQAAEILDTWLEQGISAAMQRANQKGGYNGQTEKPAL